MVRWMARVAVGLALVLLVASSGCTLLETIGPNVQARGPGAAYESYLTGEGEIVVELDHVPGAKWDPDTPAEQDFVDQVERITTKDVDVRTNAELPEKGEDYAYAASELSEMHEAYQDLEPEDGSEVMHVLFLDGRFERENTLGVAFDTRAFAVFKGEIRESTCGNDEPVCQAPCLDDEPVCQRNANAVTREWKMTRAVAIHEAGHLLGLVNSLLPMVQDHEMDEDPKPETPAYENRSHSSNDSSVMWWELDGSADPQEIVEGGDVPWRFGERDIEDARAIQGGE